MSRDHEAIELNIKPVSAIPVLTIFTVASVSLCAYDLNKQLDDHFAEMSALLDDINTEFNTQFDSINASLDSINTSVNEIKSKLGITDSMIQLSNSFNNLKNSSDCITFFQLSAHAEADGVPVAESITYESFNGNCLDVDELGIGYSTLMLPISDYKNLSMDVESHSLQP